MPRFDDPEKQRAWIEKIRKNRKGKAMGDANPSKRKEVREKISAKLKGREAMWLYGDKNPAKQPEVREKIRNNKNSQATRFHKGHIPANLHTTSENYEPNRIGSEKRTGRINTEEQIQHIKDGLPPNHREKAKESALNNMATGRWKSNSKHEDEFERILIYEIGLIKNKDFFHSYRIGDFVFDFFFILNSGVIETDGREHRYDKQVKESDKLKEAYLRQQNHPLKRFSDFEVFNNKQKIIEEVKTFING